MWLICILIFVVSTFIYIAFYFCLDQPVSAVVVTYYTHTHTHPFNGPLSWTTQVSRYQKGKPIWILLKQETVSGSGISWAICKSAPRSRQITTLATHYSVFFTARCYASAVLAMALCPSVRLSVTSQSCTKTAKRRITQTTPHDTPGTLVFWCQRSPRNSTGITPCGGAKYRWGGSKSATFDIYLAISRKQ